MRSIKEKLTRRKSACADLLPSVYRRRVFLKNTANGTFEIMLSIAAKERGAASFLAAGLSAERMRKSTAESSSALKSISRPSTVNSVKAFLKSRERILKIEYCSVALFIKMIFLPSAASEIAIPFMRKPLKMDGERLLYDNETPNRSSSSVPRAAIPVRIDCVSRA